MYKLLEADLMDRVACYASLTPHNIEISHHPNGGCNIDLPSLEVRAKHEDVSMPVHHHEKVHFNIAYVHMRINLVGNVIISKLKCKDVIIYNPNSKVSEVVSVKRKILYPVF